MWCRQPNGPATLSAVQLTLCKTKATCYALVHMHAGPSVTQTVLIHNTGNVRLRDVNITTMLSTAQGAQAAALTAYSCHLDGGGSALSIPAAVPRGSSLSCLATYSFSNVEHIEAGDLRFDTLVAAADVPPILSNMTVAVPSVPKFNMSLDAQACADALPVPDNFAGESAATGFAKRCCQGLIGVLHADKLISEGAAVNMACLIAWLAVCLALGGSYQ